MSLKTWFLTEDRYLPVSCASVDLPDAARGMPRVFATSVSTSGAPTTNRGWRSWRTNAAARRWAAPVTLSVLARRTSRARLPIPGNPLPNQPVRAAEETAMTGVKGRLERGFARGAPYEAAAANVLPYRGGCGKRAT